MKTVGYLIPEFPGQTHVWMWREIVHLREWGAPVRIYATRPPPERDRARHEFAEAAAHEAVYLWPRLMIDVAGAIAWAILTRPLGLLRCLRLGLTLPVDPGPAWRRALPLVAPACVMARDAVRSGVGLVHCQSAKSSAVIAMMVRLLTGIPYSIVVNANLEWWGGAMREKLGGAELIVTHAAWIREDILGKHPEIPDARVVRAPVGVDTRRWTPAEGGRGEVRSFNVLSVGRLHHAKRHDLLIEAVGLLWAEGRDVRLRILGGGPEEPELREQTRRLGLDDRVTLAGSVSEDRVIEEVRGSDAFALANPAEPLGVVFMEAMSCAVPVIGVRGGGVAEIVDHGRTGLLVEPESAEAIADALRSLMDDPGLRLRLGRAGRTAIVERFDSRIGARALFERLAGGLRSGEGTEPALE